MGRGGGGVGVKGGGIQHKLDPPKSLFDFQNYLTIPPVLAFGKRS